MELVKCFELIKKSPAFKKMRGFHLLCKRKLFNPVPQLVEFAEFHFGYFLAVCADDVFHF